MAELLAPAGQPASAHAAFHYGADAVYLGLAQFSARANAINFTPEELAGLAKHAHALTPRRNVYLTLNTLLKDGELAAALRTLGVAVEAGADAVIVQDLGVAALVRRNFRHLANFHLHASTQLAVHSPEGVVKAAALGFHRITLARELTLKEIVGCVESARRSGVETETFIHGTLCYSYSGLCLFSGLVHGQSGNRGRCAYSCREAAAILEGQGKGKENENVHPFSLKDLALKEKVLELVAAGVDSLKIEGRKKSPLYVAATVDYYRQLLDGRLGGEAKIAAENGLKTIFARPWTELFFDKLHNPEAVDTEVVGHRGAPLGTILRFVNTPAGNALAFRPCMDLERHDGLQIDLPGQERPYGFGVDRLFRLVSGSMAPPAAKRPGKHPGAEKIRATATPERWEAVFAAQAGQEVAVPVPEDAPALRPGQALYLASSQEVKRSFPYPTPKPDGVGREMVLDVKTRVAVSPEHESRAKQEEMAGAAAVIVCEAEAVIPAYARGGPAAATGPGDSNTEMKSIRWREEFSCEAFPARDASGAEAVAKAALGRLGESRFGLRNWDFVNPNCLFVKPGVWNRLRRDMTAALEKSYLKLRDAFLASLSASVSGEFPPPPADGIGIGVLKGLKVNSPLAPSFSWSIAVDEPKQLDAFTPGELADAEEIVVAVTPDSPFIDNLEALRLRLGVGGDKIRLALPIIMRGQTAGRLTKLLPRLRESGFRRWLVPGLNGWGWLTGQKIGLLDPGENNRCAHADVSGQDGDLAADWPLYATNRWSAALLLSQGFSYFTFSPEDEAENMQSLARLYPGKAVATVYAYPPLFISAACVHGHLRRCPSDRMGKGVTAASGAGDGGFAGSGGMCSEINREDINTVQNNYCQAKPLALRMERGGAVQVIPTLCGSVVRGETPFALTDELDVLWEMGVRRVRVDLRFSGKNSTECHAIWRSARGNVGEKAEGFCGNFRRGWR